MDYSAYRTIEAKRDGNVLLLTLNRPEKLNAVTHRLADGPILAIKWTKVSVNKLLKAAANLVLEASLALEARTFATEDHREAVRAFVEKRPPRFSGR
ncbi:MAG: hypothetical protein HYY64_17635 [Candidatus Rokubacteria bacterium]|nr:hypothetical protein [Candidatus Rokubacteria bacterium]